MIWLFTLLLSGCLLSAPQEPQAARQAAPADTTHPCLPGGAWDSKQGCTYPDTKPPLPKVGTHGGL